MQIRQIWKFAAGMTGISASVVVVTQVDKLLLSKLLDLETFGYYAFASSVAGSLYQIVTPIFNSFSPRFAELLAGKNEAKLREVYHLGAQWMAALILPFSLTGAVFAPELLMLWTRDPVVTANSHLVLSMLLVGNSLNALMNVPYAFQLAYGWTNLSLATNLIEIPMVIPLVIIVTLRFGAVGAASVWVAINVVNMVIPLRIMYRRLLPEETGLRFLYDAILPLFIVTVSVAFFRQFIDSNYSDVVLFLLQIIAVAIFSCAVCLIAMPKTRGELRSFSFSGNRQSKC
jgi:O-antigen/teichoic acid export membrane protein